MNLKTIMKYLITALIMASLAVTTANITSADLTASNKLNQTTNFLSTVVGLDMSKYSLMTPTYQPENNTNQALTGTEPPNVTLPLSNPADVNGFNVDGSYNKFKSDNVTLTTLSIFYNEQLAFVYLYPSNNSYSYIYANTPETDVTTQANNLLTRYETLISQKSAADSTFLESMKNVLNSANTKSSANVTTGNINFQSSQTGNTTRLQWIYTESGITMSNKKLEMDFDNNNLISFIDTWSIYKVGPLNTLSTEEARQIALNAAQNVTLIGTNADGTNETVKPPDLSNAIYQMQFNMLPYRGEDPNFPSKISRDPMTLYPYWQFQFYFKQPVAGSDGIQVGVWGDTSEIIYASGFNYLGYTTTPTQNTTPMSLTTPSFTPSQTANPVVTTTVQTSTSTSFVEFNTLGITALAAIIMIVIVAVCIPIALRSKIHQRH